MVIFALIQTVAEPLFYMFGILAFMKYLRKPF